MEAAAWEENRRCSVRGLGGLGLGLSKLGLRRLRAVGGRVALLFQLRHDPGRDEGSAMLGQVHPIGGADDPGTARDCSAPPVAAPVKY